MNDSNNGAIFQRHSKARLQRPSRTKERPSTRGARGGGGEGEGEGGRGSVTQSSNPSLGLTEITLPPMLRQV